jgi:hypothetical protein
MAIFLLWCALAAWRPDLWLFVVPASLPILNFSPWTGWVVFEEFDILLLGALAAGYGSMAWRDRPNDRQVRSYFLPALLALLGILGLASMLRGFADAGGFAFDWFASYPDPLNSLRVFKSLGLALAFYPLMQRQTARSNQTMVARRLVGGVLTGLAVVSVAVLWERFTFPGLFEFSARYRTVATFWEMHVGGAAIDVYLALATPFIVWVLVNSRRRLAWFSAAALALITAYASLTTFSRGVYFGVMVSLVYLAILLRAQRKARIEGISHSVQRDGSHRLAGWRAKATLVLILALVAEIAGVFGGGTFMADRLARADRDLGSRVAHWRNGLGLLSNPSDWLWGIGLGRLPANYAGRVATGEFSGAMNAKQESSSSGEINSFVTIHGPATASSLGGLYALTQRLGSGAPGVSGISMRIRVKERVGVYVELCERYLLYDGRCKVGLMQVEPHDTQWQVVDMPLGGNELTPDGRHAVRPIVLAISVVNPGGVADIDDVVLSGRRLESTVRNGDFSDAMTRWLPVAQHYFLPWHIDNLFIEMLVERGAAGLLIFLVLMGYTLRHLTLGPGQMGQLSPYLAASLCAALCVGLISSMMDAPRVAFLFFLLTLISAHMFDDLQSADTDLGAG